MFGGADILNLGERIAVHLACSCSSVVLVQGPLAVATSTLPKNVTVRKNPENLHEIMANCNWAVSNGGATMLELLYLGKAVHCIPQTTDEERLARHVDSHSALLGIGLESLRIPENHKLIRVGEAASALVDGRGITRILDKIDQMLVHHT
jgi:spore coat polysaccharide biosynthesis predicted glycosyltransferase SpsG